MSYAVLPTALDRKGTVSLGWAGRQTQSRARAPARLPHHSLPASQHADPYPPGKYRRPLFRDRAARSYRQPPKAQRRREPQRKHRCPLAAASTDRERARQERPPLRTLGETLPCGQLCRPLGWKTSCQPPGSRAGVTRAGRDGTRIEGVCPARRPGGSRAACIVTSRSRNEGPTWGAAWRTSGRQGEERAGLLGHRVSSALLGGRARPRQFQGKSPSSLLFLPCLTTAQYKGEAKAFSDTQGHACALEAARGHALAKRGEGQRGCLGHRRESLLRLAFQHLVRAPWTRGLSTTGIYSDSSGSQKSTVRVPAWSLRASSWLVVSYLLTVFSLAEGRRGLWSPL